MEDDGHLPEHQDAEDGHEQQRQGKVRDQLIVHDKELQFRRVGAAGNRG